PGLVLADRATLDDGDGVALATGAFLVVRHDLRRPANELAVGRMLDEPLDRDGHALLHLVADDTSDRAACRGFFVACSFTHRSFHYFFARSCCMVFRRAICRRTELCWSCFAPWPVAACIRRLNCSRRRFRSSSPTCASDMPRSSLSFALTSL